MARIVVRGWNKRYSEKNTGYLNKRREPGKDRPAAQIGKSCINRSLSEPATVRIHEPLPRCPVVTNLIKTKKRRNREVKCQLCWKKYARKIGKMRNEFKYLLVMECFKWRIKASSHNIEKLMTYSLDCGKYKNNLIVTKKSWPWKTDCFKNK